MIMPFCKWESFSGHILTTVIAQSSAIDEREILKNFGPFDENSLIKILKCDADDDQCELSIINHSPYHTSETCINEFQADYKQFSLLSLNAQSLRAKHDSLSIFLQNLREKNVEFSVICIQETWLRNSDTLHSLSLPNYNLVQQGSYATAHGGLACYIHADYTYRVLDLNVKSHTWEALFVENFTRKFSKENNLGKCI